MGATDLFLIKMKEIYRFKENACNCCFFNRLVNPLTLPNLIGSNNINHLQIT